MFIPPRPDRIRPRPATETSRSLVLLALPADPFALQTQHQLRQNGHAVHLVEPGPGLVAEGSAVLVLPVTNAPESGWLTCAKLVRRSPDVRVILLADEPAPNEVRFGEFVGAVAVVDRADGVSALVDAIELALSSTS